MGKNNILKLFVINFVAIFGAFWGVLLLYGVIIQFLVCKPNLSGICKLPPAFVEISSIAVGIILAYLLLRLILGKIIK